MSRRVRVRRAERVRTYTTRSAARSAGRRVMSFAVFRVEVDRGLSATFFGGSVRSWLTVGAISIESFEVGLGLHCHG